MSDSYYDSPYYNNMGVPMSPVQPQYPYQQPANNIPQQNQYIQPVQTQQVQQPVDNIDNIQTGGFKFTVYNDDKPKPTDIIVTEDGGVVENKRKRGRPRKSDTPVVSGDIVRADDSKNNSKDVPTMYTYQETTDMLRVTLAQIDELAVQIKNELDSVTASRTLKSKYNTMVGLSGNLGDILNTKISAIKEINNAITKSNDMDYKREKDRMAAEGAQNDDKYIMDMYNAFIQNPTGQPPQMGPDPMGATLGNSGIVRASMDQPQPQQFAPDNGFLSYVANMTPEQQLMAVDDNPNIQMCVIYDKATNNKTFEYMDMSTGQALPQLPARDQMFMEDTTIDLDKKIARNINLNETYPVIVINENVVDEY